MKRTKECCYEELAKTTLEALGYTVTPPDVKPSGKVVVYRWNSNNPEKEYSVVDLPTWEKNFRWSKGRTDLELIAIVDWTEGDGL